MISDSFDHLPSLSQPCAVTAEQIAAYQRDGHVLLRGVASPEEIAAYRPVIADAVAREHEKKEQQGKRGGFYKAFIQIANLWEGYPGCRGFVMARRFARIAAELMGVAGVRLYHDQALFKTGGGASTAWHQDQYYWPLDTPNTITMWMPLVDVPIDMGVLTFASGSHRDGPLIGVGISDESDELLGRIVSERGFPVAREAMRAGDATFHSGWTAHTAPANQTDRVREVMTVIYHEDGARIHEPRNPHQPADLARWFPGCNPGDAAASELNPVLYRAG